MKTWVRIVLGVAAGGLFVWTIVLFSAGSTLVFTSADGDYTVKCSPGAYYFDRNAPVGVLNVGGGGYSPSYREKGGPEPKGPVGASGAEADLWAVEKAVDERCDRRRTASVGLIALLAAPTAVLAVLSLRRPVEQG